MKMLTKITALYVWGWMWGVVPLALVLLLVPASEAYACSCGSPTDDLEYEVQKHYNWADAVVLAKVIEIERLPQGDQEFDHEIDLTTFYTIFSFKGDAPPTLQTKIALVCCVCGVAFDPDTVYLLYLNLQEDGYYSTSICTRTRPFNQAKEDIRILLGLSL